MCSRYFLDADGNVIAYTFDVPVHERVGPRYNIAPTQEAPVIRAGVGGKREVAMLRWGLLPFWAKDPKMASKLINARSETAAEKPSFRNAFKKRRCLVPASGFFEWTGEEGHKIPNAITLADRKIFAFAGLYESWKSPEGEERNTYTILTTAANHALSEIHDRMPVILAVADYDNWLHGPPEDAQALLKPYADEAIRTRTVSRALNNPRNDSPELLAQE